MTHKAARVQLYIFSHNRPHFLAETIESALVQKVEDMEIIVTDNSTTDDVREMMKQRYPELHYIHRPSCPSVDEHGRAVFKESSAELVIYFHDDDIMAPNYVRTLLEAMDSDPSLVAVGCNSWTIRGEIRVFQRRMGWFSKALKLRNAEDLARPYLSFTKILNPPPFPSYMYRRAKIDGCFANLEEGGLYADLAFLMRALERGPILWLPEPLMWYREHPSNMSHSEMVGHRLRLLRFIHTHTAFDRHSELVYVYRFRFWLNWWLRGKSGPHRATPWRENVVRRFLAHGFIKLAFTNPGFWLKIGAKVFRPLFSLPDVAAQWRGKHP